MRPIQRPEPHLGRRHITSTIDTPWISRALGQLTHSHLDFHESFRGTQYTSSEFTGLLAEHKMVQSLSRPRQCWDNAVAESFFASLKLELIDRRSWATRTQVRQAVFDYIERFFNRRRLHSSLGYVTPIEYEASLVHQHTTADAA